MVNNPIVNEKKESQERLRCNNQVRRSMEKQSLSTITEEGKSTKSSCTLLLTTDSKDTRKSFKEPPVLSKSLNTRIKKHQSVVLKFTDAQVVLPHEDKCVRTTKVKQRLYEHIKSHSKPLFYTVTPASDLEPSILVTGFGLRNISSLEDALNLEHRERLKQIYRLEEEHTEHQDVAESSVSLASVESGSVTKKSDSSETQTESFVSQEGVQQSKISYVLGLEEAEEEFHIEDYEKIESPEEKEFAALMTSLKMRKAQKYLRIHRIFEVFQFVVAHLLSALPDNPVEFIIDLLDKCMVFRSGLSRPPLLYDKRHLDCLFNLMDRMRTGFIELDQYNTGMRTLGLCSYNANPPLSSDNMVSKEIFVEEGYDCLTELLLDLIKPRWMDGHKPKTPTPPPTPQLSIISNTSMNAYKPFVKTKLILSEEFIGSLTRTCHPG